MLIDSDYGFSSIRCSQVIPKSLSIQFQAFFLPFFRKQTSKQMGIDPIKQIQKDKTNKEKVEKETRKEKFKE